jgi:VWFA-related protein
MLGGAQEPPTPVLPAQQIEVVRIEVMVTEKRGRSRGDLTREDFVVLEDGKPQPIVQFHAFARPGSSAAPAAAPAPSPAEASEEEPEDLLPARYVILAIDDVHMEFESLVRTRKALTRFLDEDLRPEDQVALVTTSGASALSQEFTSDRAALQQTLSRLSAQGRRAEWSGVPHVSEYQAELIEAGDPLALEAGIEEVVQSGLFQDRGTAEEEVRRKARAVLVEAIHNSRLTLETLESLCLGLAGLSGRKTLLFVSDGFLTGLSARSGTGYDLRRIADAGTRAGVVVYALDTRGVMATAPSVSASSPLKVGPTTAGLVEAMRRRSEEATRDAMNAIAADTGGFLVDGTNDLRAGLRAVLKDTDTYYVLAYEPTNTRRDGGFRRIEVRLPSRRDLRVRTRAGYFAPDERRALAPGSDSREQARRAEQRRAEMSTALGSLAPLTGIPVQLSADYLSLDGGPGQVVVAGNVDVEELPFLRLGERRQGIVEAVAVVRDEAGAVAATLETQRSAIDLGEADYEGLRHTGLPYQQAVSLGPGRYQVRLAVREDATGMLGSAWRRVEVPDLAAGGLALSGLFLLKEGEGSSLPPAPGAPPDLRSVQARPRFARGENLYVQLYAYNPKRDASGATDLVAQAEVLRGGARLAQAAPEAMAAPEGGGPVHHLSRIRIPGFEPGDYELRVTVTDRLANALASRAVAFTVE